jgi:staphylococcal nuclease domain-containing protein 1
MPSGTQVEAEPYGDEAAVYVKELVLQREVEIEVESMDKGGNFIGWLFCDNTNVSLSLVEEGFAAAFVGNTGDKSNYGRLILQAEETAKRKKLRRWANFVETVVAATEAEEEDAKENDAERKVHYEKVLVTEVSQDGKFFAQHVDEGPKLEQLMKQMREEFTSNPPLAGVYQPKKGDLCAAKYVDNEWYRARVEKVSGGDASVLYIDYGNRATLSKAKCAALPGAFTALPAYAKEYSLDLCALASDEEYAAQGIQAMKDDLLDRQFKLNVEYRIGGNAYVSLVDSEDNDVGKALIADGLLMAEKKGGRRLAKLVTAYQEAMDSAKKSHLNIWEYGDITADDAREFGVGKK